MSMPPKRGLSYLANFCSQTCTERIAKITNTLLCTHYYVVVEAENGRVCTPSRLCNLYENLSVRDEAASLISLPSLDLSD